MNKQINEYTDVELKAIAYDNLAQIEQCQNTINIINQELAKRQTPSVEPQNAPEATQNTEMAQSTTQE